MKYGEKAYKAYCTAHGGVSPPWDDLDPEHQAAWDYSTGVVLRAVFRDLAEAQVHSLIDHVADPVLRMPAPLASYPGLVTRWAVLDPPCQGGGLRT